MRVENVLGSGVLVLASLCIATGCAQPAMYTSTTPNPAIAVDTLFTYDGCTVYRFQDGGHAVYYANCGGTASTDQEVSCGRNCTRPETVITRR